MMKCKFKKVNNWTTTTYAPVGAFDYTTNGVTMPVQLMHDSLGSWGVDSEADMSWLITLQNTSKYVTK